MFKVSGGKLQVFDKTVLLKEGTHDIYIDSDRNISISGTHVCTYTNNEGKLKIVSSLNKDILSGERILRGRYQYARTMIGCCTIYEGPLVETQTEGFAFDYNYNSVAYIGSQVLPYMFVGGRVCTEYFGVSQTDTKPYTAIPMIPCGQASGQMDDLMGGTAGSMMSSSFAMMKGLAMVDYAYVSNAMSFDFSYRSGKKYLYFKRGYKGIFRCGSIIGGDV